jgi:O-antigen ligase
LLNLFAIPILACIFAVIVSPLMEFTTLVQSTGLGAIETRYENKLFWPALAAAALVPAGLNFSRFGTIAWPPHVLALFAYVAFAGATVLWAYVPAISFTRYAQQVMVITSIVLPGLLAGQRTDLVHGVFLCFALAVLLNVAVYIQGTQGELAGDFRGYFATKNQLGALVAVALLLSLYEALHRGRRRFFGVIVGATALTFLFLSGSKTALGFAILAPILAAIAFAMWRTLRLSPMLLPVSLVLCYFVLANVSGFDMSRVSYILTGDPTFTGRQTIWDFASYQIGQRPLLGWGYRGFWLIGPDAPSVTEAPGWVKGMPNAHSGYYDTLLELGYVGFGLLLIFLATTVHAIGRVADRDPKRGWIILSVAFFIIATNGLESSWMRDFEVLWVVFLILTVETARYWQRTSHGSPLRDARPLARAIRRPNQRSGSARPTA